MSGARYAKHNLVRFKSEEGRETGVEAFNEFFKTLGEDWNKKMHGHVILESLSDPKEAIVLTFWETKDHMDSFYSKQNNVLENLVEKVKPLFEKMPERTDHTVSNNDFSP